MLKELLPSSLCEIIDARFAEEFIYELRVRCNKPIYINYKNSYIPLKNNNGNKYFIVFNFLSSLTKLWN